MSPFQISVKLEAAGSSEILVNIYTLVQDVNLEYQNFNSHFGIEFFLRGNCCSDT